MLNLHPSPFVLSQDRSLSYREALRKAHATTYNIKVMVVLLLSVAIAVLFFPAAVDALTPKPLVI